MAELKGVYISVLVSLCAIVLVRAGLAHPVVSHLLPMYIYTYSLLLTAIIFFLSSLPPEFCFNLPTKRNELYYMCCLFMSICTGNATMQAWRLEVKYFRAAHKVLYFSFDEPYRLTPFGMSTSIWNDYINYFFYLKIIYNIDNCIPYRNLALYWSGAMLTSELVALMGSFTGLYSNQLQYSEFMHVVNIAASAWVIFKFVVLCPRYISRRSSRGKYRTGDKILVFFLALFIIYHLLRGIAGLNGKPRIIRNFIVLYEPYIIHPGRYGAIWVIYLAVYGIPFHVAAIRALVNSGSEWMVNMSILYAASVLQGTFVYLSYSLFPSAEKTFVIPSGGLVMVVVNLLLVIIAHCLMYRCLKEPGYFLRHCLRNFPTPANSDTELEQSPIIPAFIPNACNARASSNNVTNRRSRIC